MTAPSNSLNIQFPKKTSPFLDSSGQVSQAWYQLLLQLFARTGGTQGVSASDDLYTDGQIDGEVDRLNDEISALPTPVPIPWDDVLARLDQIESRVAHLNDILSGIQQALQDAALSPPTPNQTTFDQLILANQANGSAAQVATLVNGPTAGNPTIWFPVKINGVTKYMPAW